MGLVGCASRYCKLRCNMLVAVDHGHVMPYFVLENMLRYANGMFVILGGLVGLT